MALKIDDATLAHLANADIALDDAYDEMQLALKSAKDNAELFAAVQQINTTCENLMDFIVGMVAEHDDHAG